MSADTVYLVAEAASNFDGNLAQAKKLVDVAKDAGADAVKFQLFKADVLYPEKNQPVHAVVKANEFPRQWLPELCGHAKSRGIDFLATPFDAEAVDLLEEAGVKAYKWGSSETTNHPLLLKAARTRKPVYLSTGMCTMADIAEAVEILDQNGCPSVTVLHCYSVYPTAYEDANLRVLKTLRHAFGKPVGFSDHSLGIALPIAAAALGATVIEKHFTLDRTLKGPDHSYALEPRELKEMVLAALRDGSYRPSLVRRVDIPKPGGGTRMLGVPTVLDRVIQQAIVIVLTPILDPTFSQSSYGFRPKKSAHDAVRQAREFVREGHRWVVDLDLSKFFDRVNHDILLARLARRINDKRLLRLIRRYLQAGMMSEGVVTGREEGTPQGGPLSPLLANVLLDDWDKQLEARGHKFCRYADDCNIYVKSKCAGERVMAWCVAFLEGRLRLKVNADKSAVDRPWNRKFLGLTVTRGRQPKIRIAAKSRERFEDRVRDITSRRRGISIQQMVRELNRYLQGWFGYFRLSETPSVLEELDGWIRRRLRCFLLKQWKPGRGRRKALQQLGISDPRSISGSRKGPWRLSKTQAVHMGLDNSYFQNLGLFNLSEQWRIKSQAV